MTQTAQEITKVLKTSGALLLPELAHKAGHREASDFHLCVSANRGHIDKGRDKFRDRGDLVRWRLRRNDCPRRRDKVMGEVEPG